MLHPMALFAVLQLLDVGLTLTIISLGGYEANPLMAWLVRIGPAQGLILGKLLAFGLFLALYRYRPAGVLKIQAFYACVVLWNLTVLTLGRSV